MLLEELEESILGSLSLILNWGILAIGGVELESRESLDLNSRNFVFGGINLDQEDLVVSFQSLSSLFVDRSEGLAVSAPWSVEFNQNVSSRSKDDVIEALSDNDLDSLVVLLRDFSRLEVSFELFVFEVVNEPQESLLGDLFLQRELGEVPSLRSDDPGDRGVGNLDTDVVRESLSKTRGNSRVTPNDLSLLLPGSILESLVFLAIAVISEENDGGGFLTEDSLDGLITLKRHDNRVSVSVDEGLDAVNRVISFVGVESFVELLVEDNISSGGFSQSRFVRVGEGQSIVGLGDLHEVLEMVVVGTKVGNDDLVVTLELVESSGIGNSGSGWSSFLLDPVDDLSSGSSSIEVNGLPLNEELDSRVSLNLVLVSELLVLRSINLSQWDGWIGTLQDLGSSSVFRGKLLAVSTPWGVELNEEVFKLLYGLVEVVVLEDDDIFFFRVSVGGVGKSCTGEHDAQDEGCDLHLDLYKPLTFQDILARVTN